MIMTYQEAVRAGWVGGPAPFATALRLFLRVSGWSQTRLAAATWGPASGSVRRQSVISLWCRGKSFPKRETLERLLAALPYGSVDFDPPPATFGFMPELSALIPDPVNPNRARLVLDIETHRDVAECIIRELARLEAAPWDAGARYDLDLLAKRRKRPVASRRPGSNHRGAPEAERGDEG